MAWRLKSQYPVATEAPTVAPAQSSSYVLLDVDGNLMTEYWDKDSVFRKYRVVWEVEQLVWGVSAENGFTTAIDVLDNAYAFIDAHFTENRADYGDYMHQLHDYTNDPKLQWLYSQNGLQFQLGTSIVTPGDVLTAITGGISAADPDGDGIIWVGLNVFVRAAKPVIQATGDAIVVEFYDLASVLTETKTYPLPVGV